MEAIKEYSEGLKRDPNNHLIYSNRGATYIKVEACIKVACVVVCCSALHPPPSTHADRAALCAWATPPHPPPFPPPAPVFNSPFTPPPSYPLAHPPSRRMYAYKYVHMHAHARARTHTHTHDPLAIAFRCIHTHTCIRVRPRKPAGGCTPARFRPSCATCRFPLFISPCTDPSGVSCSTKRVCCTLSTTHTHSDTYETCILRTHTRAHAHAHARTRAVTHANTRARARAHTHTHTHTHTHAVSAAYPHIPLPPAGSDDSPLSLLGCFISPPFPAPSCSLSLSCVPAYKVCMCVLHTQPHNTHMRHIHTTTQLSSPVSHPSSPSNPTP